MDTDLEMRRKKILENAEARLRKIKRISLQDVKKDFENKATVDKPCAVVQGDICNGLRIGVDQRFTSNEQPNQVNTDMKEEKDIQLVPKIEGPVQLKTKTRAYVDIFIFITLGISMRLFLYSRFSSVFVHNILGPFLVVCLPRLMLYLHQKPELPRTLSIILYFGFHENELKTTFRVLFCIRLFTQYFALYLFSFIITHCIIKELNYFNRNNFLRYFL